MGARMLPLDIEPRQDRSQTYQYLPRAARNNKAGDDHFGSVGFESDHSDEDSLKFYQPVRERTNTYLGKDNYLNLPRLQITRPGENLVIEDNYFSAQRRQRQEPEAAQVEIVGGNNRPLR